MTTFKRLGSAGPLVFWEWYAPDFASSPFLRVGITENSNDAITVVDKDGSIISHPTKEDWEGKKFRLVINTQGKLTEVTILKSRR